MLFSPTGLKAPEVGDCILITCVRLLLPYPQPHIVPCQNAALILRKYWWDMIEESFYDKLRDLNWAHWR